MTTFCRAGLLAAGLALAVTASDAAEPLITGKAIYEITIEPGDGAVQAGDISGTLTAALTRVCRAYVTEMGLSAKIAGPGSPVLPLEITSRLSEEGAALSFDINATLAGFPVDRAEGLARNDGDTLKVSLTEPTEKSIALDGPVHFPAGLIEAVIAAAEAGETLVDYKVYDGSGNGSAVWRLSVTISPVGNDEKAAGEEALFVTGLGFDGLDRWRIRFTYFDPRTGGGDQTPAFSTEAIVYENGFALGTVYNMGPFSMRLTLSEFQPIAPTPCP